MFILCYLIQIYTLVVIARLVLGWFTIPAGGGLASAYQVIFTVTEPVLAPVRSVVRPVQIGSMALDLSAMIVLLGLMLVSSFVCR